MVRMKREKNKDRLSPTPWGRGRIAASAAAG